jgi:hypothetical protein
MICVLSAYLNAGATTCVSNKKFKVKQVCGRVTDPSNAPIPMVSVELSDAHSVVLQQASTNDKGIFSFQSIMKGEYVIQIRYAGFATAWQPFIVTKNKQDVRCNKPMQVRLEFAGRCSSISKAR